MKIQLHISLRPYNTMHIDVNSNAFCVIHTESDLVSAIDWCYQQNMPLHILGGGSNVLFTKDVEGLLIMNKMKGIQIVSEDEHFVCVKFMSGEIWHECVMWCIEHNYGGIENLSLIPGTIGAAPIQNIGAYGVELKDVFQQLEAMELESRVKNIFTVDDCKFGYRESVFKQELSGKFCILSVTLKLSKVHTYHTTYGNIQDELNKQPTAQLSIKSISDAVIAIRQSKLPNPVQIGNAGSFFKNPLISKAHFTTLKNQYPAIPNYPDKDKVKIPAAWLIEQCHWKGFREGDYGVHAKQALCLVNYANATGLQIYELSARIITSVQQAFNITLEREVNIW
ncbi:MAG: UDP-N-acetylmuramate dehydrogenase [Bacteroidetes bacterium]|nr:UDP-N-acetylmuramate dehydrogenase [Bacteroidota bacterium]